jgi:hypothetical protein
LEDFVPIRFLEENILIGNDLIPISRLGGDIFYRGSSILDAGYWMSSHPGTGSRFGKGIIAVAGRFLILDI